MQEPAELDMDEEDAFLGDLDVDALVARHRQSQAASGTPKAPQSLARPANAVVRVGNQPHAEVMPLRQSQAGLCPHGVAYAACSQRWEMTCQKAIM